MTRRLIVREAGPAVTVQDLGRPGHLADGLSRGGAMDRLALYEGAALLGQKIGAAVEMIGSGGTFDATQDTAIALTGAPMQATLGDRALAWHASHRLPAGETLRLGGVRQGAVGYLHVGGGLDVPEFLGARSAHLGAGIGARLEAGTELPLGADGGARTGWVLEPEDRFRGGTVHLIRSLQSDLFGEEALDRLTQTEFTRDARANRQGIRLNPEGEGFALEGGLTVVSEIIAPGDIQITGDGAPFVLMSECQTTGGYPRIATVLPCDLPRIAQAPLRATVRFVLLDREAAVARERQARADRDALPGRCRRLVRDPAEMTDLLRYPMVGGVVDARADPFQGDQT